ncbi:hypothetical protein AB0C13_18025 [Streptomyces sp. NPDC049099]|uniref:hypothetical protein n=1 Tax=Streptomyces sp. NPDC049099 TaxID=3155768 RepID=UPI0034284894
MGLVAAVPAAAAPTRVVNCNENPYALQPAIDVALPGTVLQVQGRCIGPFTFSVDKNLTLSGRQNAVLDGNRTDATVTVQAGVRVHFANVTITNGTGHNSGAAGGGIFNDGTVTLDMSTVSGGSAEFGGGIFNDTGATLTVNRSTVSSNTSGQGGGGILNAGMMTMDHSAVSGNTANRSGGGIVNQGTANLTSSNVSNNATGRFGGGIAQVSGTLTLDHATVIDNTALNDGGGIFYTAGTVTLTNSRVRNNAPDNCAPPNTIPGCTG